MALFVLSLCPFDISVGVGAFVIGLSQISSFFSFQEKEYFIAVVELLYTERTFLKDRSPTLLLFLLMALCNFDTELSAQRFELVT